MKLPDDNTMDFSGKVKTISCTTQKKLTELFAPMNKKLYEFLRFTQNSGQAPPMEPNHDATGIGKSWEPPSCHEFEMHVGEGGELVAAAESSSSSTHGATHGKGHSKGTKAALVA